ncbi:MAG: PA14 domain-containing protein, partial [Bacteroidota bacterium]
MSSEANAEGQSDLPTTDTVTVISDPVTVSTVEQKIDTATATLTSVIDGATATVQAIPNVQDIVESSLIATQAVDSATAAVNIATTAISNAETATATALVAKQAVDSQTVVVTTATTELITAQLVLTSITQAVDSQTVVVEDNVINVASAQAPVDEAGNTPGLKVEVYNVQGQNNAPVLPENATPILTFTDTNGINEQWGGGAIAGSTRVDDVIVIYSGIWTPTTTGTEYWTTPADDGVKLFLDGTQVVFDWYDKGGGGSTVDVETVAGVSKTFVLWYYENGGGAFVQLLRYTDSGWVTVPGSEFCQSNATQEQLDTLNTTKTDLAASQATLTTLQGQATIAQTDVVIKTETKTTAISTLSNYTETATVTLNIANQLADTATVKVQDAV